MEKNQMLMKHFAGMLKDRATGKVTSGVSESLLKFFSRKELIEVLTRKGGGKISQEWNIAELENEELLSIIGDEMFILSYYVEKWCVEMPLLSEEKPKTIFTHPKKEDHDKQKSTLSDQTKGS
jgi:hypothetical protein